MIWTVTGGMGRRGVDMELKVMEMQRGRKKFGRSCEGEGVYFL